MFAAQHSTASKIAAFPKRAFRSAQSTAWGLNNSPIPVTPSAIPAICRPWMGDGHADHLGHHMIIMGEDPVFGLTASSFGNFWPLIPERYGLTLIVPGALQHEMLRCRTGTSAAATLDREARAGCIRSGVPDRCRGRSGGGVGVCTICVSRRCIDRDRPFAARQSGTRRRSKRP